MSLTVTQVGNRVVYSNRVLDLSLGKKRGRKRGLARKKNAKTCWEKSNLYFFFLLRGWLIANRDNTSHFSGVFVFCLGSFFYSIALIRLACTTHEHLWQLHYALELFLFITTACLLVAFIVLWLLEENSGMHKPKQIADTQTAYIVEHCAYLAHLLFYTAFFTFHTPDPLKDNPQVAGIYEAEGVELVGITSTLSPLMES